MNLPSSYSLDQVRDLLSRPQVIPAHPLALSKERKLDVRHQRALTRYYVDSGATGLAIGVHTTQFEIRQPEHDLLKPVLMLAAETVLAWTNGKIRPLLISGICGKTEQAVSEATLAASLGYDAGLVSLSAFPTASDAELIAHCRKVSEVMPIIGFYLQPAVGGRVLSYDFWKGLLEIPNVVAIKVAPFNRYQTLEVMRALADVKRDSSVVLLTGNDDNIVVDLLTEYQSEGNTICFGGGLLGQWSVGTKYAANLVKQIQDWKQDAIPKKSLDIAIQLTDLNSALFDASNGFKGCIAGIHEVLVRKGLMTGRWCLNPDEDLSPGQMEEINRVMISYPEMIDDEFIGNNLKRWLED